MTENSSAVAPVPDKPVVPVIAGLAPTPRRISAGDTLFRKGDATIGIFYVTEGRLRMQRVTPDGGTVTQHVARPGEMFAEASLFSERYQCDVVAEMDSMVWLYPKNELTQRLRGDLESLWSLTAGLARNLHGLRQRYELKQIRSASQRVLQLLRLHCDEAGVYSTTGVLKDMAAELGLTHEALYRALAKLEREGRVERSSGALRVIAQLNE
jgi:CRP-like cAMP-binding protein